MFETEVTDGSQELGFQQEVAEAGSGGMEGWVRRGWMEGIDDR